jgi:hypothetical protein
MIESAHMPKAPDAIVEMSPVMTLWHYNLTNSTYVFLAASRHHRHRYVENANYPSVYDILFYAFDKYVNDGRLCRMVDKGAAEVLGLPKSIVTINTYTINNP